MNFPNLACNKCNLSEKDSFSITKGSMAKNKDEINKDNFINLEDNNQSTNNLEIIDYPYSFNSNQDETKTNHIETEENNDYINEKNLLEKGLNDNIRYRNNNRNTLNSSSLILKNEDSITQNKILLKNLYNNNNKYIIIKDLKKKY